VEYVEYVEEEGGLLGLDIITLTLLGVTIASLILLIDQEEDIDDIKDRVNQIPISP
jgi:hypothetical protein